MHLQAHRLAAALNAMVAGDVNPGQAEALLTGSGQVHHVADHTGALGLPAGDPVPLRSALGRVAATSAPDTVWQVFSVHPGRIGGLRGPLELTRLALEHGAVAVPTQGGPAWVPLVLGTADEVRAVQWMVVRAERPVPTPVPAEAQAALQQAMSVAENGLRESAVVGSMPAHWPGLELPAGYPPSSARLVTTALRMAEAAAGARTQAAGTSSFELTRSEGLLSDLYFAAVETLDSAVSWPTRALHE